MMKYGNCIFNIAAKVCAFVRVCVCREGSDRVMVRYFSKSGAL